MEAFLGTILAWPMSWAPAGWAICDGRQIPIQQNQALFSLLGYTYGGTLNVSFALPDLRGRFPLGMSIGVSGIFNHPLGATGGAENITLQPAQVPLLQHKHNIKSTVSSDGDESTVPVSVDVKIPVNTDTYDVAKATNTPGATCTLGQGKAGSFATNIYTTSNPTSGANLKPFTAQGNITVPTPAITVTSECDFTPATPQPAAASVNIMPPYQTVNYIIALTGIYPVRD
ncbi:microcystin-dependent protein [Clostridium tetanomorphum]|uniref:Phage tail protein n=1 Tax=Clostridium tetanomorphum TaxID=1553 RepID=A0A923J1W5_CLOTT|nr:tail fiber protein [Clostridium tetanomorphum]KAJ50728.1 Phage Tail Collar [Clostridium tetanomorphum DSM 665]MBC2399656.1 phage tail protein [Clostridium tetanomorphum]MBP1862805.1 microcystin-dependent protein [Clostridium tetanomorphum]NRS85356.1 microcystin-dependent protein [Clostridium tetanomorphum]NRZ98533.1 microcystin-dependent protein [Clostridium tetanomorphum]